MAVPVVVAAWRGSLPPAIRERRLALPASIPQRRPRGRLNNNSVKPCRALCVGGGTWHKGPDDH